MIGTICKKPIRILLADHDILSRAGIRALLERSPRMKVVAEAADSRQALRLARSCRPDVVVMDAALADHNGLWATTRLHQKHRVQVPVVLLSETDGHLAAEAFKASASAYLLMNCKPSELNLAIRRALQGKRYIGSPIIGHSRKAALCKCEGRAPSASRLTARQREILRLIAEGSNTKEIASFIGLSPKTIEFHRTKLMSHLNTRSIAGLVRHAIRLRLVSGTVENDN